MRLRRASREASQRERTAGFSDDLLEDGQLFLAAGLVDENPRARDLVENDAGPELDVMGAGAVFFPLVFEPLFAGVAVGPGRDGFDIWQPGLEVLE